MDSGASVVVVVIVLALLGGALWMLRAIWRFVFSAPSAAPRRDPDMTAEDEGNAHSGPYGYTVGAYPETQYGSGFDPDADWAEHRGD